MSKELLTVLLFLLSYLFIAGVSLWAILSLSNVLQDITATLSKDQEKSAAERLTMFREFHSERSELLNRIKPDAPQYPLSTDITPLAPVNLESDEEYWNNIPSYLKNLANEASNNGTTE